MNTYLLVTETTDLTSRAQEYVTQYEPAEMADLFTPAQIAALKAGEVVTKKGRFAVSTYRDMVACTKLHRPI